MDIIKVRDKETGQWVGIPALVGSKGDPFTYEDFTPEQLEALNGTDAGYNEAYNAMKLAIDMSDTDYQFNETVTTYPSNWYRMNLNFTDANGVAYKQMAAYTSSGKINIQYVPVSGSAITAFNAANEIAWAKEAYRTIHITDGDMIGDIETFRWLIKNGTINPTK